MKLPEHTAQERTDELTDFPKGWEELRRVIANAIRAERREAGLVLSELAGQLDAWARGLCEGGLSACQVEPMRKKADELRRYVSRATLT